MRELLGQNAGIWKKYINSGTRVELCVGLIGRN